MTSSSFYCFPDISRKEGRRVSPPERAQPAFQRVALAPRADGSRSRAFGSFENVRPGITPRVHAEDIEQAAFCRGFSDGEKKGYEQGERDGREAALKQLEPVLQSLRQMLAELESLRRRETRHIEQELVGLALAVARKVVGQEVAARPEVVAHLLRDAIHRLEHAGALTIRMNPADLERLSTLQAQLLNGLVDPGRVRFEADPSLGVGGCFIESEAGDIDARVEHRFRIVEEALQAETHIDSSVQGPCE